ncbi:39860_t:CDS:2 [Gigaspora margarita]|uniref:39860_t:CDS:1 n=1 Tax=Gigaspora margarita TaxID=4874 RepID=A0ABN7U9Z3_GIGMA|nr:39860_t:CDS:2 [Gigaspora margarita]
MTLISSSSLDQAHSSRIVAFDLSNRLPHLINSMPRAFSIKGGY